MDFTAHWHWPQWTILAFILIRYALITSKHGEQMLVEHGARKGEVERYNAFGALSSAVIWLAVLICGGFFA